LFSYLKIGRKCKDNSPDLRAPIIYHRAYRKISDSGRHVILEFFLFVIPLEIAIFLLYPEVTYIVSSSAKYALSSYLPIEDMMIIKKSFITSDIYMLNLPGKYPSPLFSFLSFLVALINIFLVFKSRIYQPIAMWLVFLLGINLISSAIFILAPSSFPYTMQHFSELYITTEVGVWLFVPVIMGLALLPIPTNIFSKFIITVLTTFYSIIFGIVRYIVFLFILTKLSYIFMPVLYFSFGPLVDFIYIVGIYSLYVSHFAEKLPQDLEIWKWIF
jgi:hypothetical protein